MSIYESIVVCPWCYFEEIEQIILDKGAGELKLKRMRYVESSANIWVHA